MTLSFKFYLALCFLTSQANALQVGKEEDWGEGLKVLATHIPKDCKHKARRDDVISYHYIGKLASSGQEFGKSFDYNSPYIVGLDQGRIIAGMDRGLMNTCLWERRRITIPPHLGYGMRGVGEMIPPNATLVFYIRMIKIERNGAVLGLEENLDNMWNQGMQSYSNKRWKEAIDSIEQSLKLYEMYQNATKLCLKSCANTNINLTKQQHAMVDKMSSTDPLFQQFLVYSARAKCIKECKIERLPPPLRQPDPSVLKRFQKRDPYAFLHYAYYQIENYEEGFKCVHTYYFHNPNDSMAINSLKFYRTKLNISQDHLAYREPGQLAHNKAYTAGVSAYQNNKWLEAVDNLELAVSSMLEAMDECRLMCEDVVFVNLTNSQAIVKRQDQDMFRLDSMEWHHLVHSLVKSLLECRTQCLDKMATINGVYKAMYLSDHFNHLQFAYYKLGLLKKAAKSAATCFIFEPSNSDMADNVKYYHSQGVALEDLDARKDIFLWHSRWEAEERLLQYAATGQSHKKGGLRGDDSGVQPHHQEL